MSPLLHIGYPKCLSSWMQQRLFVPEYGMQLVMGPFPLQTGLVSIDPLSFEPGQFLSRYASRLDESGIVDSGLVPVCSSENLVGKLGFGGYDAAANADKLHACFPEARILVVVREQRSMIRSLYKTLVAWGSPHSLGRLLQPPPHWQHVGPHFRLQALEYDRLLDYYRARFGAERVKLLCYEQFQADPEAFVRQVLDHAGLTTCDIPKADTGAVNPGTSLWRIEKHRLGNRLYRNLYNANAPLLETEATQFKRMQALRRAGASGLDRRLSPLLERRFSARLQTALAGRFGASNRRLQALSGIDLGALGYELGEDG